MPQVDPAFKPFMELPDIENHLHFNNEETENIALIPVFSDTYFNKKNFVAYLKAAIYSRQTFLIHSDAPQQQIPIYLYIEDKCRTEATSVLNNNCIAPETDVIWFKTPSPKHRVIARLAKKLCLYYDSRLTHYERVIYWDADMFKVPNILPDMFSEIKKRFPIPTFLNVNHLQRRHWRPKMIRDTVKNTRLGNASVQEVFEEAELGRVLQNITGTLAKPTGGLCIFPAKMLNEKHTDFLSWIKEHANSIGDDENCIALAAHKFGVFLQMFFADLTHVNAYNYFNLNDKNHPLLHGKTKHTNFAKTLTDWVETDS